MVDAQEAAVGQLRGLVRGGPLLGLGQLRGQAGPLGLGQGPVGGLQGSLALGRLPGRPGEAGAFEPRPLPAVRSAVRRSWRAAFQACMASPRGVPFQAP